MKILVFGDTHGDLFAMEEIKQKAAKVDLIICIGDVTYFEHDLDFMLEVVNEFPKPVILTHGNHELAENVEFMCSFLPNIQYVHRDIIKKGGFNLAFYGGDGFSKTDSKFEKWICNKKLKPENTILFLHGPPHNTKLDIPFEDHHCGNKSTRKYIEKKQPLMTVAGHIHECEEQEDWIGESYMVNPGPLGMIFDLKEIWKKRKNREKFSFRDANQE